jgi:Fe-S-cluster containining protein
MEIDLNIELPTRLKAEWFQRFDRILSHHETIPHSNLRCLELCEARCCPRIGMRQMPSEKIASPIVVLLPFEMEYLIEKSGASQTLFRIWPIDLTPDLRIEIGMFDLGKPCPFLQENRMCSIHEHNPLDCRTFPLLPSLSPSDKLEWTLGENCPSLTFLNQAFSEQIKRIWEDLVPVLPRTWWDLYSFADHWTGWTQSEELARAD